MLFAIKFNNDYICIPFKNGRVAEWLGRALQKLVQRFESALDLRKASIFGCLFFSEKVN